MNMKNKRSVIIMINKIYLRENIVEDEQPRPIKYNNYLIVWIDKFNCWCIYDENGNKVREPLWENVSEAKQAIDSEEAL